MSKETFLKPAVKRSCYSEEKANSKRLVWLRLHKNAGGAHGLAASWWGCEHQHFGAPTSNDSGPRQPNVSL